MIKEMERHRSSTDDAAIHGLVNCRFAKPESVTACEPAVSGL